jgi:MoaA/NifB/PqqE/SkfB family radical SAM enzyme
MKYPVKNCEVILNEECNARCVFCYQPGLERKAAALPFKKAAEALYRGRKNGCWVAYLIGGEITLRDDLSKIVKLARHAGYPCVHVMSNGLKLSDPSYARGLVEAGANLFTISVHGYSAAIHDKLVGVKGAFNRVRSAIGNLLSLGAQVRINNALNRLNYKTVDLLCGEFTREFGLTDINIIFPHYSGMMMKNAGRLSVTVTEVRPHLVRALDRIKDSGLKMEGPLLINFCPCNLPRAAHLMGEWARPLNKEDDEELHHLDGQKDMIYAMKERIRVKNLSCRRCAYDRVCMGFEKWYADVYGGGEFTPVVSKPRPFPLKAHHERLAAYQRLLREGARAGK